ncbi:MAG: Phenylacetate-coenzyme ligase [Phycisphaerales bacterium]|nr:Phenylacetate-coenzyme ligase [Phycisphaerales bacterium]
MDSIAYYNPAEELLEPAALVRLQRQKLAAMLREIQGRNAFYTRKFAGLSFDPMTDPLEKLPFTTRLELEADQIAQPPYGTNLTYPVAHYCRLHQTSGSGGRAMRWLDTRESWDWFKRLWGTIYRAAGVRDGHRLMFPFSFGPFVGFWAAFESAASLGNLALAAGGMTTTARLKMLLDNEVDVVCCTPTYALRMAEVARAEGIDLARAKVSKLIVAGEPGGSVAAIRERIQAAWGARVYDHTGMTEIGALGFECDQAPGGVHLHEAECIAEVIDPVTAQTVADGETGELVLTNLGRWGSPLIRYRTNDQVRLTRGKCSCGRWFARLEGGILGRYDDMITVRGNNVFPAGLEAVIRQFSEVTEFRVTVVGTGALAEVQIELEPVDEPAGRELAERVGRAVQNTLSFRAQILTVPCGALPRFEMKAKRFIRRTS